MKYMILSPQLFILVLLPKLHLFQYSITPIRVEEYQISDFEEAPRLNKKAETTLQTSLSRSSVPTAPPSPLAIGGTPRKAPTFFSNLGGSGRFSEIKKPSSEIFSLPNVQYKSSPGATVQGSVPSVETTLQASLSRSSVPTSPPSPLAIGGTPRKAPTFFSILGGSGRFSEIKKPSSETFSLPNVQYKSSPGAAVQVSKPTNSQLPAHVKESSRHSPGNLINRPQYKYSPGVSVQGSVPSEQEPLQSKEEEKQQRGFRGSLSPTFSKKKEKNIFDDVEVASERRPFRNRGGGSQFSAGDYEDSLRGGLLGDEEEIIIVKPKLKPIKCHTGASNELYANPQNCRKYYKCSAGKPSLQSCPANLIFDKALRICNWPSSVNCEEDSNAPLPEIGSSDRAPPNLRRPTAKTIYRDTAEDPFYQDVGYDEASFVFEPEKSSPALAHPGQGSVPSEREALQREKQLISEYPLFEKVKKTVSTLDTKIVEMIKPRNPNNPDNVRRVELILSEENYEHLFPRRHHTFTYRRLLQAIGKFPAVCGYLGEEDKSDIVCRRTLATMFAHFTQETGAHNPSDKDYEEWRQGLHLVREQGCSDTGLGCGYNQNCEGTDSITKKWACGEDRNGKYNKYYGRGAKQLSYNYNYGQFSQAMFGNGRLLLDYPDFVADTWLNLASATWFYTTPQPPKPSMLHVIDGTWVPNSEDRRNGITSGFGATINIINGAVECKDGKETAQARNRIEYYKRFAWYLSVDYENEELGCSKQQRFSAGSAGALPIYWERDWAAPFACKLVNYQTAHSALVEGEYIDCLEENFEVAIRGK